MLGREADELVGRALTHAADGEIELATRLAEKVERLAPWSPRYLELQVYLDEEGARRAADHLVTTARESRADGRAKEARAALEGALAAMPGHAAASRLLAELEREGPLAEGSAESPTPNRSAPARPGPPPAPRPGPPPGPTPPERSPASRQTEAEGLTADALRLFTANEHERAREAVARALELDPSNRRARELHRILRVLG
jgi:tetratricopeptide (TPR) repeat protein